MKTAELSRRFEAFWFIATDGQSQDSQDRRSTAVSTRYIIGRNGLPEPASVRTLIQHDGFGGNIERRIEVLTRSETLVVTTGQIERQKDRDTASQILSKLAKIFPAPN